jgi:hypothetical protein
VTPAEALATLRASADHPDTDCVAYVDEVVPLLLDIVEKSILLFDEMLPSDSAWWAEIQPLHARLSDVVGGPA